MPAGTSYKLVKSLTKNDGWCFAIVNGKLAEIYFRKNYGIWAHCYEKAFSYKTKKEKKWIKSDTKKFRFSYKKGYYYDFNRKLKQKVNAQALQK